MGVTKLGYGTNVFQDARAIIDSNHVAMDMIMCLLGTRIANGKYRTVYEHALDPTKIIKIEYGYEDLKDHDCVMRNSFCNVQEFLLWKEIQYFKGSLEWVKDWFAPIEWISPSGHILCMEKTDPKPIAERPEMIPAFLWDVKQDNFGWIGEKLVCHDYAHVAAHTVFNKRMKKVKNVWESNLDKTT